MSSEGVEEHFSKTLGVPDEFKLGDEEKQLIQQFAFTEIKEEVDSDAEYQVKKNVDATKVKEEVISDVEQDGVRATEEGESDGRYPHLEMSPVAVRPMESMENIIVVPRNPPLPLMDVEQAEDDVVDDHQEQREEEMNLFLNQSRDEECGEKRTGEQGVQKKICINPLVRLLFICPVKNCPSSFKKFKELVEHMKAHTGKQNFFCDVCKKDFSSKAVAMAHIQERNKMECCGCGKNFQRVWDLMKHYRSHTGEKPHKCNHCDYRCSQRTNLLSHERIHTGEKPFSCGYCEKRFASKDYLKTHELAHTREKPFECKDCEKKFNDGSRLEAHIRRHHGKKPFACHKCDERFEFRPVFEYHLKTYH